MLTARLTDKGQLVIPKPIRDQLHLAKGSEFAVSLENGRVILQPSSPKKKHRITDWLPDFQVRRKLNLKELCAPVDHYEEG